ncbi:hypothetical protein niasHT_023733 [Heterodera trifolii]|uniref:G-protein coupled receptors family 1 profile domain-containing protein n=1 Tax=Heterodera trifolii TaxID=157864 RepID=A0ABD2K1V1_9BILA
MAQNNDGTNGTILSNKSAPNSVDFASLTSENESLLNVLVGCAMMALSSFCLAANLLVVKTIVMDKNLRRQNSYKFMSALCLVDCSQSVVHFITGFFTIDQSNFDQLLSKALGVIATPSYVFYAIVTIVLAIHRLTVISSSVYLEELLFSPIGLWFLLPALVSLSFALALSSPWAAIVYWPDQFSWAYDDSRPLSHWVQYVEEIIELGGIPLAGLIYAAIFFTILYKFLLLKRINGLLLRQTGTVAEVKVLIQAFVITIYCTVLNYFWHNSEWLLPNTKMANCALNFMWIANGAVNPIIYFAVNAAIRQRISASFGVSSPANTPQMFPHISTTVLPPQHRLSVPFPMQNNFLSTTNLPRRASRN